MDEIDNLTNYLDALHGEGMISLQGLVELLSVSSEFRVASRIRAECSTKRY